MIEIEFEWEVRDGYTGGRRPQKAVLELDVADAQEAVSNLDELREQLEGVIQAEFEESENIGPELLTPIEEVQKRLKAKLG
jgi:hypothetical protein